MHIMLKQEPDFIRFAVHFFKEKILVVSIDVTIRKEGLVG